MKKLQRLISGILVLCLMLPLMPVSTLAEELFPETTVAGIASPAVETAVYAETEMQPIEGTTMPTAAETEAVVEILEEVSREAMYDIVDSGTCGERLTWTLDSEGTLTISGTGAMENYNIYSNVSPWYTNNAIMKIVIEEGVTTIGDNAFYDCNSLSSVVIPDGVTSIGNFAFESAGSLKNISLPSTVTSIGRYAFARCGLQSIFIPEGTQSIGSDAFYDCRNLASISLPSSVTDIAVGATGGCVSLQTITVDAENPNYSSIDGVLFDRIGEVLLSYPGGRSGEYSIPDGVKFIQSNAFNKADKLTKLIIPKSVQSMGVIAVTGCTALSEIFFEGDAPSVDHLNYSEIAVFPNSNATAYYPENNTTWTEDAQWRLSRESNITWLAYTPEEKACRLDELTDVDYMAFSAIAYKSFSGQSGKYIEEAMIKKGVWDTWFSEEEGITYADLCNHIAQWKVLDFRNDSDYSGFYAVAFVNDNEEVVIAYRGSTSPAEIIKKDGWEDWIINDLPTQLFNKVWASDNQYEIGFDFFEDIRNLGYQTSSMTVTGHSLGGGLADIVSARYGCKGVSMNAICIMDAIYDYAPLEMGEKFEGVDKWNFVDHANYEDICAGMFEYHWPWTEMIKPLIAHESNTTVDALSENLTFFVFNTPLKVIVEALGDVFSCHGLKTYITKDASGNVVLTDCQDVFYPTRPISKLQAAGTSLDLGTSADDIFNKGLSVLTNRTSFGGAGYDGIYTSIYGDLLIGGKGNDMLDGGRGNDRYVYYKGDGYDQIMDVSGTDTIYLRNFSFEDEIEARSYDDSDYINILCNGETIISIYKKNRDYRWNATDTFLVNVEPSNWKIDITELFSKKAHDSYVEIYCPVNVEILDSDGNVVYTLLDGEVGAYYTDYGNFYVFEEEDGGYGKALDLVDGYTARVVGVGEGTMKIDYREVVDGELAEPKNFADVPITTDFTATFEETDNGGLVLAADTDGDDIVDTKIGYDGKPVTPDTVTISQEYIVLKPGDSVCLEAKAQPASLTEFVQWSVEGNDETVVSVDENGTVTANGIGTSYVLATVEVDGIVATGRCRVDVAQTEVIESAEPEETVEVIKLDGIQLSTNKLTAELYSTNYAEFDILLKLPQNFAATAAATVAMPENKGVAITSAKFTDPELADLFDLVTLDDRTIAVVPNEKAVWNSDLVGKSYSSAVTVTVQGKEYTSEALTLTVKKTLPKLKATVPAFNNFWSGQTQKITVTGATVTGITCENLPDWLEVNGTELSLNENVPTKGGSAKLTLLVETEEWAVPVETTLAVKCSYKAPGLKLSASSIQLAGVNSDGVKLQLLSKDKKLTLGDLGVSGISAPEGYSISNYNVEDGSFVIRAAYGFQPGKINLAVSFQNTAETVAIPLTVKVVPVTLKLAPNSITLNSDTGDSVAVNVTATPADYRLTAPDIRILDAAKQDKTDSGELKLSYENGRLSISTTDLTPDNAKYTLYISAEGGKEAALKISTTNAEPTLKLKAAGNLDLSFPDRKIGLTTTFKNHSGGNLKAIDYTVTESIGKAILDEDSKAIQLTKEGADLFVQLKDTSGINIKNTYTLNLKLTLENGKELESSVKIPVKQTAVNLKLSANKLTLNKAIGDKATVTVTCATKDYNFTEPVWTLLDSKGREVEAGILDISWTDGKLTVATTEATPYGGSYKLQIAPEKGAKAVTLAIVIPAEAKSTVTGTLKAAGNLDVIRDGTALTVTPTWKNCNDAERTETLTIRNGSGEDVTAQFVIEEENGKYILTRAGALDHTQKYTATLTATFTNGTTATATGTLKLKMGSAKLTVNTDSTTLFANDKHSRVNVSFASIDHTLNGVAKVTLDPKLANQFELFDYGNGQYAIGFKDGAVPAKLTSVNLAMNVWLEGNETAKANASVKVKLSIVR